ncbi:hypothetical protein ABK040_010265 [Willaertia magna]
MFKRLLSRSPSTKQNQTPTTPSSPSVNNSTNNNNNNSSVNNEDDIPITTNVLLITYSICPICSFVEDKGVEKDNWKEALLVKRKNDIWLVIRCQQHGEQQIKICSDFNFFMKTLDYSPSLLEDKNSSPFITYEIEEIEKTLSNDGKYIENTPLIIDIDIFENDKFINNNIILHSIEESLKLIKNKNVIFRINGKLVENIKMLNEKLNFILSYVKNENSFILELSFDRLIQLSKLNDTCLLNNRIYPSLQIFLPNGMEKETTMELSNGFSILKQITNLQIIVRIVVSRPFPKLDSILNLLRFTLKGLVKFIIIEQERTPNQIMKQFKSTTIEYNEEDESFNLDPLELLKLIEKDTKNQITVNDFFPASVGMILEPFLSILGKGNYNIRPSPFCAFATCLINSENQTSFPSVPITRLLNVDQLFTEMLPIIKGLKLDNNLNLVQLRNLKKAFEKCLKNQQDYPIPKDLFSYITSKDVNILQKTKRVIDDCQFLIIHNVMDVGVVDLMRRTRCSSCHYQLGKGFVSSCTNCI